MKYFEHDRHIASQEALDALARGECVGVMQLGVVRTGDEEVPISLMMDLNALGAILLSLESSTSLHAKTLIRGIIYGLKRNRVKIPSYFAEYDDVE